jgi:hypothetical protein
MAPFDFFQIQNNLKQNLIIQKIMERRDPRIDPNSKLETFLAGFSGHIFKHSNSSQLKVFLILTKLSD